MKGSATRAGPRTRLLVGLAIAFIPLVILEAYLLQQQADVLRSSVVEERRALASSEAQAADEFIAGNIRALQAIARAPVIAAAPTPSDLNLFLKAISDENPVWLTVALSGSDGFNISSLTTGPRTVNISDRDYFQGALAGRPTVGSAILARALNVKSMVVAVPVELAGGGRGVLSAALSLGEVETELRRALPESITLRVVDRRGQEFIGPQPAAETFPVTLDRPEVQAALRGETGAQVTLVDGVERLLAYAPAAEPGWAVILSERAVEAFAAIDRQRQIALLLTGVALVVALASAGYLGTRLERTYRDIEEARSAVDAERRRLSAVVDELPVAVALYDPDGRALLRNAAYYRLLGGTPPATLAEAVRYYQTRRVNGRVLPADELPQQRALRGEVIRSEPLRLKHAESGEDVHVLVDAVPLERDGADRPIALVVIHDITGLRKTEQERTEFFEMASHEIKTPLTVLVGSVELARRFIGVGRTDKLDEILRRADEGGHRLSDLVRDLLDLTRLDAGKLDIRREAFDLVPAVQAVVDETRLGAERHELTFAGPAELMVNADPRRIAQILQNVLDNAVRYSPEGGRIDVRVAHEGTDAVVRVTDHGIGIPEQERAQLFQRFFRTTRSRSYGGTGLGLFISRRIAEAHSGRLWLERTGTDGSTFAFALPALRRAHDDRD